MKCEKCNKSVFEEPLQRVNEMGIDGIWWCESCIKKNEPELHKNILEDKTKVEKVLEGMFYQKSK